MTSSPPPREPGPEPGTFVLVARLLAVQLLAVIGVAGLIAAVFALAGRGTGTAAPVAPTTSASASARVATATPPGRTPPPSSAPPAGSAPPAPATVAPATSATAATTAPADRPKVDVLNQSAGTGRAARTAKQLRTRGWRIGRVADFRGNVSRTTVYYPKGLKKQARALARDLPGAQRVLPGFSTLSSRRLSVILVRASPAS